jgi:hypothetical protein
MAAAQGAGVIAVELGTHKVDNYVSNLYKKVPQDVSFTKRTRECIASSGQVAPPNTPLIFHVPGKYKV